MSLGNTFIAGFLCGAAASVALLTLLYLCCH
jgi:hypothetical protein